MSNLQLTGQFIPQTDSAIRTSIATQVTNLLKRQSQLGLPQLVTLLAPSDQETDAGNFGEGQTLGQALFLSNALNLPNTDAVLHAVEQYAGALRDAGVSVGTPGTTLLDSTRDAASQIGMQISPASLGNSQAIGMLAALAIGLQSPESESGVVPDSLQAGANALGLTPEEAGSLGKMFLGMQTAAQTGSLSTPEGADPDSLQLLASTTSTIRDATGAIKDLTFGLRSLATDYPQLNGLANDVGSSLSQTSIKAQTIVLVGNQTVPAQAQSSSLVAESRQDAVRGVLTSNQELLKQQAEDLKEKMQTYSTAREGANDSTSTLLMIGTMAGANLAAHQQLQSIQSDNTSALDNLSVLENLAAATGSSTLSDIISDLETCSSALGSQLDTLTEQLESLGSLSDLISLKGSASDGAVEAALETIEQLTGIAADTIESAEAIPELPGAMQAAVQVAYQALLEAATQCQSYVDEITSYVANQTGSDSSIPDLAEVESVPEYSAFALGVAELASTSFTTSGAQYKSLAEIEAVLGKHGIDLLLQNLKQGEGTGSGIIGSMGDAAAMLSGEVENSSSIASAKLNAAANAEPALSLPGAPQRLEALADQASRLGAYGAAIQSAASQLSARSELQPHADSQQLQQGITDYVASVASKSGNPPVLSPDAAVQQAITQAPSLDSGLAHLSIVDQANQKTVESIAAAVRAHARV